MDISFDNKNLLELYEKGKSMKYKVPQNIARKYVVVIEILKSAQTIHDLWKTPSLNFKKLSGDDNKYSARLSIHWRIEMDIEWQNDEKTVGIINLIDVSNHYGD